MMIWWDRLEKGIVGLLGIAALCAGIWQVIGRYLFPELNSGWGDEVVVYLIIWAIMIVSSQLVRTDGHVRPDVVLRMLKPGVQRWLEAFNCLVAIGFCVMFVYYGWDIVNTALLLDERSETDLGFPMWIYDLSLPVGFGLMAVRYVIRFVRYVAFFDPATMSVGHVIHEAHVHDTGGDMVLPPIPPAGR